MKQFACGSVVAGCHAAFHAPDEDGILRQVAEHAARDHGVTELSPQLITTVRENMTTVAA